jgi:hypothetical protein
MKNLCLIVILISCIQLSSIAQNSKKEAKELKKEEQYQELLKLVDSQQYAFQGSKANPQQGRQIDLTTRNNFLRIKNGNAHADMPYFGRAYSGGYSTSDGGVKFDGPMENYEETKNDKKRRVTIKFKVKGIDDTFSCTLNISGINSASLSVISNKRQSISYTGAISELQEEKEKKK